MPSRALLSRLSCVVGVVALGVLGVATPVPARTARAQAQEIAADRPSFDEWVASIRTVALARGIRPETLDVAFADLAPLPVVVERDRTQAEVRFDLDRYLKRRLTRRMPRTAGEQLRQHHALLDDLTRGQLLLPTFSRPSSNDGNCVRCVRQLPATAREG